MWPPVLHDGRLDTLMWQALVASWILKKAEGTAVAEGWVKMPVPNGGEPPVTLGLIDAVTIGPPGLFCVFRGAAMTRAERVVRAKEVS